MKAFFIIILVFFVTLGCIIHNAISVKSFASEYEGQLAGLEYSDAVGFSYFDLGNIPVVSVAKSNGSVVKSLI